MLTARGDVRWAHVAGALIVGGSVVSVVMMATAALPAPGYALDPHTGIPVGDLFPGYLRLLTPVLQHHRRLRAGDRRPLFARTCSCRSGA